MGIWTQPSGLSLDQQGDGEIRRGRARRLHSSTASLKPGSRGGRRLGNHHLIRDGREAGSREAGSSDHPGGCSESPPAAAGSGENQSGQQTGIGHRDEKANIRRGGGCAWLSQACAGACARRRQRTGRRASSLENRPLSSCAQPAAGSAGGSCGGNHCLPSLARDRLAAPAPERHNPTFTSGTTFHGLACVAGRRPGYQCHPRPGCRRCAR